MPFPIVALSKSAEGWGCGIPLFGFAQGRLLRKAREAWGALFHVGVSLQQVPHRAFCPVRNDKIFLACGTTEVEPFRGVALSESAEGWGCGIPLFGFPLGFGKTGQASSQSARRMGHPWRLGSLRKVKVPTLSQKTRQGWGTPGRGGFGLQQVPHRAFSPVRNDKICGGLRRGLKPRPFKTWSSGPRRCGHPCGLSSGWSSL